jgi:hypothetical protein
MVILFGKIFFGRTTKKHISMRDFKTVTLGWIDEKYESIKKKKFQRKNVI